MITTVAAPTVSTACPSTNVTQADISYLIVTGSNGDTLDTYKDGLKVGFIQGVSLPYTLIWDHAYDTVGVHTRHFVLYNLDSPSVFATSNVCTVNVFPVPVLTTITVSPASQLINTGSMVQLTAVCKDQSDIPLTLCPPLAWVTNNSSVAQVSQEGLVTAISVGTADISCTGDGVTSNTSTITVVGITATSIISNVPGNICTVPCPSTITVTWTNVAVTNMTFVPSLMIDGSPISPAPYSSEILAAGASVTHIFLVTGLTVGSHQICPDPK